MKDRCEPSSNKIFALAQPLELETVATAVLSKHKFLLLEWRIVSCEIEETVVTAVFGKAGWILCSGLSGTTVGGGCGCLELVSLSTVVQRLVWCLRLQLRHQFSIGTVSSCDELGS